MKRNHLFVSVWTSTAVLALIAVRAMAVDASVITGNWAAMFDSQVGVQTYTFTFKVDGTKVTGRAKSSNGDDPVEEGKIDKDTVTFVENMNYQGMMLRIAYTGTVIAPDEIHFKRDVGGQGGEDFTAKRQK